MNKYKFSAVRFYVTEKCNASCPNCFNAQTRSNSEMDLTKFTQLCEYFNKNEVRTLKIMGGEPSIHKDFLSLVSIAQKYFKHICIFSNGLSKELENIVLRENDSVIYNFRFAKAWNLERFVLNQPGKRIFEVQVNPNTDVMDLVSQIKKFIREEKNRFSVSLTLDCTSDIFSEKKEVVPKLLEIEKLLNEANIHFSYDHKIPFCYLYNTGIHTGKDGICKFTTSCLIDSSFNLRFCNQHPEKIMNIFNGDKIIPWPIIQNHLLEKYYELQISALNKVCMNCIFFDDVCNGGCWINSMKITKQSIMANTDFPIKQN